MKIKSKKKRKKKNKREEKKNKRGNNFKFFSFALISTDRDNILICDKKSQFNLICISYSKGSDSLT